MRKLFILIACVLLSFGCEREQSEKTEQYDMNDPSVLEKDSFSEGIYMGYFVLRNQNYWCQIEFINNTYEEWPSGGANFQKEISCLTKGNYSIENDLVKYELSGYKFPDFHVSCTPEMILPGDYKIHLITLNDSLIFSKGVGENKIKYYLSRVSE